MVQPTPLEQLQARMAAVRAALQEHQARELRVTALVNWIKENEYTRKDVFLALARLADTNDASLRPRKRGSYKRQGPRPMKYQHPEDPDIKWSGYSRKPRWFLEQLDKGRTAEEMLIINPEAQS